MGKALRRIQQRKKALDTISDLMSRAEQVIVIHYSCETFYDRTDGTSPRITSIAVRNLATAQTTSFSIHQMAERAKVPQNEIEANYDRLEKVMLDEFYEYVRGRLTHTWLHWNMRDIVFGFPAIAHRYRVLGGNPVDIHESNLADLARLTIKIYGVGYIGHPRLENLIAKNKISDKDFLGGENEAKAFEDKEYVKLHQSTLRKVDILAGIIERIDNNSLKTNSTWKDLYGAYPEAIGDFFKENWAFSIIAAVSAVIGIIAFIISLF